MCLQINTIFKIKKLLLPFVLGANNAERNVFAFRESINRIGGCDILAYAQVNTAGSFAQRIV